MKGKLVTLTSLKELPMDRYLNMCQSDDVQEIVKRYPDRIVYHYQKGKWNLILVELENR